jgi:TonB-dependent starch-binding outer membrane protein SusC
MEKNKLKMAFSNTLIKAMVLVSIFGLMPIGKSFAKSDFKMKSGTFLVDIPVKGNVVDAETGDPLPGVSVAVKGTSKGAVTDPNGNFNLVVTNTTDVLVFSYVGYMPQQLTIGNQTELKIRLAVDAKSLGEVVVVGYGTAKKSDLTGSVKSVKSEDFNKGIINSPEQLLQGKIAGVNVTSASGEPGGAQGIQIRGPGGVRTGSTPLFVVDGLALDNSSTGGATNPLTFLNPQDIESIDVLKDASATAIYGARGANGVILITTKKGKAGVSSMNYSTSYGISKMANPIKMFTADEYRAEIKKLNGTLEDLGGNTDWQKEVTRTAITKNHNLALSGGAEKLTYYASFGIQKQEGILKGNNLNRYNGRINVNQKLLDDRLNIEANINANSTTNNRPPIGSLLGGALSVNPTYPVYDAKGELARYPNVTNPLISLALEQDITTTNRVIGNISPSLTILKGLIYKLNYGIDNSTSQQDLQNRPNAVPLVDGRLETRYVKNTNSLIENYLTYTFDIGENNFSVLGGHSYQQIFRQERATSINKFAISDIEPQYNPGLGQELTLANNKPTGSAYKNELQSYFSRVNYQYKDKYLVTATVRADGSSKFGSNNKYGIFPSFSVGWKLSEEEFIKDTPFRNLKLRAGWGQTGNQEIPSKITQPLFTSQVSSSTSYPLNSGNTYVAGTTYTRLANPDIQWEVSTQTNIGVDFGFFNGALSGSVDWFNKVSNDILLEVIPSDPVQPAGTFWTNVSDMTITNKGLEIDLSYRHRSATGLNYEIGGNTTFINNVVNNSPYSVIPSGSASGSGLTSATINGYINGQPIGTFYLRDFNGFDEKGASTYRDVDGDGVVGDKDRIAAGTALPTFMYNFFTNFSLKGFDLNVNFNGVSGNKVYDNTANSSFYKTRLFKGVNTTAEAIASPAESTSNSAPVSTRYLKDGAFLRLNNLALGYSFNTKALGISKWVPALRLSVTGQNLFVITKYDGFDPEVNTDRTVNGISSYGIDYLSYPKARSVIFGLNVTF